MGSIKLFSAKFHEIIKDSIKSVVLDNGCSEDVNTAREKDWNVKTENNLLCSYCRAEFENSQQQREHYKLDWHRYNLKQSLLNRIFVTEEEFDERTGKDDLSSISGSDSEKEDTLDTYATAQGKIFLQNEKGHVFSMYRCLILDKKEELNAVSALNRLKDCCINNQQWAVLMLGGGHFAGAVFKGDNAIVHKTFHCYTVRAGQGGSQSSRDNKSGGSHPKSAGASLRRYNEQALVQHVKGIVETWQEDLAKSSLIFYRASGPYNRSVLFGGATPLLDRNDTRLRTIPFSTRRATFTEVQRVHSLLSLGELYDTIESATSLLSKQKSPERNKARSSCINRAKSREIIERPLPGKISTSSSEDNHVDEFVVSDLEIDLNDSLQEFGDSLSPEQRKKPPHKKKKPKKSKTKKLREQDEARRKEIVEVLCKGDVVSLKELLENSLKSEEGVVNDFVNQIVDSSDNSLLHVACMNEHNELVEFLLENNANPCLKNKSQQTPYTSTQNQEIRETLKQFARNNPEKFNYNKAHIPINALTNEELADRKRAHRKIKREKEKEKRKETEIKRKEDLEKDRFLQLSDREKRALAAERRILSQSGAVIARCFLCGSDMAGLVPFEYLNNRFCSIECLKAHRLKSPVVLS